MTIRRILVAYAGDPGESEGLRIAIELAGQHDASLTGVVVLGPTFIENAYKRFFQSGIQEILDERNTSLIADIRARFEQRVTEAGIAPRATFRSIAHDADHTLSELAQGYDLIVYCDHPLEEGRAHIPQTPSDVVEECGCPMLLVPEAFAGDTVIGPTLIAWDGGRTAARAVGDALQLGLVTDAILLEVKEPSSRHTEGTIALIERLKAHDVPVRTLQQPAGRKGVTQTLLDTAEAEGVKLIVMGAYEHSRLREELLGGVTHGMMRQKRMPVLFSN